MSTERRSGATRTSQPVHMLRETRYLSREEMLRELRNRPTTFRSSTGASTGAQQRRGVAG